MSYVVATTDQARNPPPSWARLDGKGPGASCWVREPWHVVGWDQDGSPFLIEYADGERQWAEAPDEFSDDDGPWAIYWPEWARDLWIECCDELAAMGVYLPGDEDDEVYSAEDVERLRWRPAITMPRWMARYEVKR